MPGIGLCPVMYQDSLSLSQIKSSSHVTWLCLLLFGEHLLGLCEASPGGLTPSHAFGV